MSQPDPEPSSRAVELFDGFLRRGDAGDAVSFRKLAAHEALWHAQHHLRAARDADGRSRYQLRDWAGWVLTGEPD